MNSLSDRRFASLERLYGASSLDKLMQAHVAVLGVGGVGSWVVEALARCGIGQITLVDPDHVAISNINRQLGALESTLGYSKLEVLATRARDINPAIQINCLDVWLEADLIDQQLSSNDFNIVIDAIDQARTKAAIAVWTLQHNVPLFIAGGAGARTDLSLLSTANLWKISHDKLLANMRYYLRKALHAKGLEPEPPIAAVYLPQAILQGAKVSAQSGAALNCAGFGSSVLVTASMGFRLADLAIQHILK